MGTGSSKYTKLITRDWCLMFCEDLHKANTRAMRSQFGWGYSDIFFVGKDGLVTVYRNAAEQRREMIGTVESHMAGDPDWFRRKSRAILRQRRYILAILERADSSWLERASDRELTFVLRKVSRMNVASHPYYAIVLWAPTVMKTSHKMRKFARFVADAVKTREAIHDFKDLVNEFYMNLASRVLKRQHLSHRLARYVRFQDIYRFLNAGKPLDESLLAERSSGYILSKGGISSGQFRTVKRARGEIPPKLVYDAHLSSECLRGTTAYRGCVTGRARVILTVTERAFRTFRRGEILVTHMTSPKFLPLLIRSSAVITDEGGILCHAAILSRENAKPCIVGTRRATRIFKSGDLLAVDAAGPKGIVRKVG